MKKSKRDKFFDMCGEYPEDMFGEDWENYIDEWLEEALTYKSFPISKWRNKAEFIISSMPRWIKWE